MSGRVESRYEAILARNPGMRARFPHYMETYFKPYAAELIAARGNKHDGYLVNVFALQGVGKNLEGDVMEEGLAEEGHPSVSLSVDNNYLTHRELCALREEDPRYIRRGVTHDIPQAHRVLMDLKTMREGDV